MVKGVEVMSHWTGLDVYLPDGRKLGIVHDAVIDAESLHCTHLFLEKDQKYHPCVVGP